MSYTPTPQVPVTYPDLPDGETQNAAHDRALLDAVAYVKTLTAGAIERRPLLRVEGTSSTVFAVYTGSVVGVVLKESGLGPRAFTVDPSTLTLADVVGLPAAMLASHWYYVYAKVGGGVAGLEIRDGGAYDSPDTANQPDVSLHWRGAVSVDTSRHYLGCFPTNGSGVPRWVQQRAGRYVYRTDAPSFTVSNDGSGFTAIDLSTVIPPHAATAEIMVMAGTVGTTLDLRTPSSGASINVARGASVTVPVDTTLKTIDVRATTGGDCVISVRAFEEG